MKRTFKSVSFILALAMTFQLGVLPTSAIQTTTGEVTVISQEIHAELESAKQIARLNDTVFYASATPELSFCSQVTSDGKIQFSYIRANDGIIVSSDVYDITDVYNTCNIPVAYSVNNHDELNTMILENIDSFTNVRHLNGAGVDNRISGSLNDEVIHKFGSDYMSNLVGSANKSYNNKIYNIRCTESQTTTTGPLETFYFTTEDTLTAVTAFILSGGWTWTAAAISIATAVVKTYVVQGIEYVASNFQAQRAVVTSIRTRIALVSGYSQTQYWAGWTRKLNFFKGNAGWTSDSNFTHNVKHTDYDNVSGIMETGFQNFIYFVRP